MARVMVALGKWLLRAGLGLTVLIMGLGYDPAPCFQTLQDWAYQVSVYGREYAYHLNVSKTGGEYLLKSNIGGLRDRPAGLSWKRLLVSTGVVINEPVDMVASHMQPIKGLKTAVSAMPDPRGLRLRADHIRRLMRRRTVPTMI